MTRWCVLPQFLPQKPLAPREENRRIRVSWAQFQVERYRQCAVRPRIRELVSPAHPVSHPVPTPRIALRFWGEDRYRPLGSSAYSLAAYLNHLASIFNG